jgi:hypothetical protein
LYFVLLLLSRIKGGLGTAAANCVSKVLHLDSSDTSKLLISFFSEILCYDSSRDSIKCFKSVFEAASEPIKSEMCKQLCSLESSSIVQLLLFMSQKTHCESILQNLLLSNDEFVALESFSLLVRADGKFRRRPADLIPSFELNLFQNFIEDVIFSGSVDFRQKCLTISRSFYEQIFARLYHLCREVSKNSESSTISITEANSELSALFHWLGSFVKFSLIELIDLCCSNFGSVDFVLSQVLCIFSAFEGNSTLVAASPAILSTICSEFQSHVIDFAIIPSCDKIIRCVSLSTYDTLRVQASEIALKCKFDSRIIHLDDYKSDLRHPRAINNESAARIILLHARLTGDFTISRMMVDLKVGFDKLKMDFPSSLHDNNINGLILLLRFFMYEKASSLSSYELNELIKLSLDISSFVSNIASHPSPEGLNLISEHDETNDSDHEDSEFLDDNDGSSISSQYVLSFAWRAVKETSLLIESVMKTQSKTITKSQVQIIADHFIESLLTLRHCGAFRALQNPLSTALRLGYSLNEKLALLNNLLSVCLGFGQIQTTRRSAGLPFLILSLTHCCSGRGDELSQILEHLVPPLVKCASGKQDQSESGTDPKPSVIHAFNIVRGLVRDSKISNEMGPHMHSIAKLCLDNFNSAHWDVRNATSMLLSSLISRIFGPKYINDLSSENHYTDLREIEINFDGLLGVFLQFLKIESSDLDPRIAYPLLAILERIKIPLHERFNDFRSALLSFLSTLLAKLEEHPENGRKLGHVLGRTVYSILQSKSLSVAEIEKEILQNIAFSTPNGLYNILVLIENIRLICPEFDFTPLTSSSSRFHPILQNKMHETLSHKSHFTSNLLKQNESPVIR